MSVLSSMKNDSVPRMMYNTGTLYDLMTGSFTMGVDGKWYLNGGLPPAITGVHGAGNMFKSTFMDSLIMGAVRIYQDTDYFNYDTEGSKSKARLLAFLNDPLHEVPDIEEVGNRVTLKSDDDDIDIINVLWAEIVKMRDLKNDNIKDLTITLPFIDLKSQKPMTAILPTFAYIDSLTELKSSQEKAMIAKEGLESSKNKTIWLVDGNNKTSLIRSIRPLASKSGICFICSAHKGKNGDIGSHLPPKKQLQYMRQADRMKGVGSRFEFATHSLLEVASAKTCVNKSDKHAEYPDGATAPTDLNELLTIVQRGKGNASGTMVTFIVSQEFGLLNAATNLHYLRQNNYDGLTGGPSVAKNSCVWYPDVKFSRKSVRNQAANSYELSRALELSARYRYIQMNWNLSSLPFDFSQTFEQVYDKLLLNDIDMKQVLNTTGYWNYQKTEREYMSIFDLLALTLPKEQAPKATKASRK